jgi:hypothetical protein
VSLPFISFGGSSLVVVMTGVGLLMNISRRRRYQRQVARADLNIGRGDRRGRVSRVGRRGSVDY